MIKTPLAQKRREEILAAARKCFLSQGFHATGMTDIAREFGMSVGHVYNYFPSKQAIIEELIERGINEFYERSNELWISSTQGDFERVRKAVRTNFAHCRDKRQLALSLELLVEAHHDPKLQQVIVNADKKVRAHLIELYGQHVDLEELKARMEVTMAMIDGMGVRVLRNPDIDLEAFYDDVASRIFLPRYVLERRLKALEAENRELKEKLAQKA